MVFDLDESSLQVAFGSPAANPWYPFGFGAEQPGEYESILPREQTAPQFWAPAAWGMLTVDPLPVPAASLST